MVEHPAGYALSSPTSRRGRYGLQVIQHPGHPGRVEVSGPHAPWPTRSHAYASPRPFLAPSQGLLPARAGSPLAGQDSHLLDDTQSFMESLPPPIPFDPQGLVALNFLSADRLRGNGATMLRAVEEPTTTPRTDIGCLQGGDARNAERSGGHHIGGSVAELSALTSSVAKSLRVGGAVQSQGCCHPRRPQYVADHPPSR